MSHTHPHTLPQLTALAKSFVLHPEQFADVIPSTNSALAGATKSLYILAKKNTTKNTKALDTLLVEGFDQEQVWEQLQLLNLPIIHHAAKQLDSLAKKQHIDLQTTKQNGLLGNKKSKDNQVGDSDDEDMEDMDDMDMEDVDDVDDMEGSEHDEEDESGEEDEGEDGDEDENELSDGVDEEDGDKERFTLEDLDDFAEQDMEADEELGDLLGRAYDNDDDDEDVDDDELAYTHKSKGALKSSEDDAEASESEEKSKGEDNEDVPSGVKSRFETEMSQMQEKIKTLEDAAVAPKKWMLMGEASYKSRPTNSLLAEELFFDFASKPPPVITQERTASLEDIIKQRISKGVWDDVIRKKESTVEYKPTIELDSSKNTEGLAKVYENQYLKSVHGVEEEGKITKIHSEAQALFKELCAKLDALSHFHYTPKPVVAEANVKSTAPALSAEEATPAAVSSSTLIAPQELLAAPRSLKDKSEMSSRELKAHRRHRKEIAKKAKANKPPSTAPISTADALKDLKKNKNVTVVDSSAPTQKTSSSKFFKAIQELGNEPAKKKSKKKSQAAGNSKTFKL